MAVAPDAANRLKVSFKSPAKGSCLTPALLAEIANLLVVEIVPGNVQGGPCVSSQNDNLSSLDSENCIYTPGVARYRDQQTWLQSSPQDLTFEGWSDQIDATVAQVTITPFFADADIGQGVCFMVSRVKDKIIVKVAPVQGGTITSDVDVEVLLVQNPVPPQQT